jgi:hypothetical protein
MPGEAIESVLQKLARRIVSIPGVVGIAEGESEGEPCIKVYVARKTPELMSQIPSSLEGYAVRVEETGEFRALGE